VLNYDYSVNF